jgi:hypothetical protein
LKSKSKNKSKKKSGFLDLLKGRSSKPGKSRSKSKVGKSKKKIGKGKSKGSLVYFVTNIRSFGEEIF